MTSKGLRHGSRGLLRIPVGSKAQLGGGYSVQKTLRGCAANTGSKISLWVYDWHLVKMQNLVYEWVNFSKFSQIWAKIEKILEKIGPFCSKFGLKLAWLVYEWVTFSWKIGICMSLLSIFTAVHPYQDQTWVPDPTGEVPGSFMIWWHFECKSFPTFV